MSWNIYFQAFTVRTWRKRLSNLNTFLTPHIYWGIHITICVNYNQHITETILEQFQAEQLDEVYIIYTNMVNSVTTEPQMMRLLPIIKERFITKDGQDLSMYQEPLVMTPSPKAVLDNIVPDFVMGYVYGALVESFCSEQNARMMAMEAANKNASAMIHDLSIQYNRVRQAMITQEITEVIAGAKAQKKKKKARKEVLSN